MNYNEPLMPDTFYHIYNHAVGNEYLFRENANYNYFLELSKNHLTPICDLYAFGLLPNHFHFLIKTHPSEKLIEQFDKRFSKIPSGSEISKYISKHFSNLFNAYAKAYNKRYTRRGSLFIDYFRRKRVENHIYMKNLMHYIHYNPVLHELCSEVDEWKYTSYQIYLSDKNTKLNKTILIENFEGKQSFIEFNKKRPAIENEEFGMY